MQKTYYISGMHCISCETLIKKELNKIDGVKVISINHKNGKIELEIKNENKINDIKELLEKNNYSLETEKLSGNGQEKNSFEDYVVISLIGIIFVLIYFVLSSLELTRFLPIVNENISFVGAFLVGIGASISTCLALLGGIVISLGVSQDGGKKTKFDNFKSQTSFQMGRILGFMILGGILGEIGSFINISSRVNGVISIIISLIILYTGLQLLRIVPSITKIGIHLPKSLGETFSSLSPRKNLVSTFLLGILTFFVPCGFTQAIQLVAIGSGSFLKGATIMGAFAIGTLPVLFTLGLTSYYSSHQKGNSILKKIIGVLIVILSLFLIYNSSSLVGKIGFDGNSQISTNETITNETITRDAPTGGNNDKIETIKISHNGFSTTPREINLKQAKQYKLIITPESDGKGCFTTILIPGVDENVQRVVEGQEIIFNIPALTPGRYNLVCSAMGMTQGTIVVE